MPSPAMRSSIVRILPAVMLVGILAGCVPGGGAATPSPTTEPSHGATSSAEPSETPVPTPSTGATPITFGCDELLTADDIYAYNPNVGEEPGYSPTPGTIVAEVADDDGLACGWVNQTSGERIEVAVSQPAPDQLTAMKQAAAATMSAVPTYGTPPDVDGFFSQSDDIGTVQVFTDTSALVARSTAFFEPGDAGKIIEPALSNLP